MNHEFCMNCGGKASFEINKPKFCPSCGNPFNTSLGSSKPAKKTPYQEPEEEERELDVDSIDIEAMRKQISFESYGGKVSLNDLWSNPAPSERTRRPAYSGGDAASILTQIKQECSPVVHSREVGE